MTRLADFQHLTVPGPTVTSVSRPFWQAAAEGRFVLQHCPRCSSFIFYPRAICPVCWSGDLAWRTASGGGRLKTWSTVVRPAHPAWEAMAPYTVGLVELAEGPTMLSHILAQPEGLSLALLLRVCFVRVGATTLPFFEPAR